MDRVCEVGVGIVEWYGEGVVVVLFVLFVVGWWGVVVYVVIEIFVGELVGGNWELERIVEFGVEGDEVGGGGG